jgi:hypothetical protein
MYARQRASERTYRWSCMRAEVRTSYFAYNYTYNEQHPIKT